MVGERVKHNHSSSKANKVVAAEKSVPPTAEESTTVYPIRTPEINVSAEKPLEKTSQFQRGGAGELFARNVTVSTAGGGVN
ncbi:unnamed protein product [Ectocarpus sp. 8 AP-2014]